jgi:hypothetical protein
MRLHVALSVLLVSSFCNPLLSQQVSSAPSANSPDKPRIYVTDSNSWSVQGSAGGANGAFAAQSSGGARPQTAEIIKTFGQRCPQVTVNNRVDASNYVVELDHEGGKGLLSHKDKIAVFVQKTGDSIFSKSTMSLGGSVQDACEAITSHWSGHSAELKAVQHATLQPVALAVSTSPAQVSSITVDASAPNCDIEVDGAFVGSTPSTLNLAPGKHDIVVKKTGYKDWIRSMNVGSGAIRVSAEMAAAQ